METLFISYFTFSGEVIPLLIYKHFSTSYFVPLKKNSVLFLFVTSWILFYISLILSPLCF